MQTFPENFLFWDSHHFAQNPHIDRSRSTMHISFWVPKVNEGAAQGNTKQNGFRFFDMRLTKLFGLSMNLGQYVIEIKT